MEKIRESRRLFPMLQLWKKLPVLCSAIIFWIIFRIRYMEDQKINHRLTACRVTMTRSAIWSCVRWFFSLSFLRMLCISTMSSSRSLICPHYTAIICAGKATCCCSDDFLLPKNFIDCCRISFSNNFLECALRTFGSSLQNCPMKMNSNLIFASFIATGTSLIFNATGGYAVSFIGLLVLSAVAMVLNLSLSRSGT